MPLPQVAVDAVVLHANREQPHGSDLREHSVKLEQGQPGDLGGVSSLVRLVHEAPGHGRDYGIVRALG